jgi:hypothetical protein
MCDGGDVSALVKRRVAKRASLFGFGTAFTVDGVVWEGQGGKGMTTGTYHSRRRRWSGTSYKQ